MAPKGGNEKKESGRAKKAANAAQKQAAADADKDRKEAENWSQGSKSKNTKEEKEEKRKLELEKKAERERLLAAEEAATSSSKHANKAAPKAGTKKKSNAPPKPAGPGAIAAGGGIAGALDERPPARVGGVDEVVQSFSATGIDDALDLLEVVNAKSDKASKGQQAAGIERHPERRFKAAFAEFKERELPGLKENYPGLRHNQYEDKLRKLFDKSPDNPFNQQTVAYDATKGDRLDALDHRQKDVESRLQVDD